MFIEFILLNCEIMIVCGNGLKSLNNQNFNSMWWSTYGQRKQRLCTKAGVTLFDPKIYLLNEVLNAWTHPERWHFVLPVHKSSQHRISQAMFPSERHNLGQNAQIQDRVIPHNMGIPSPHLIPVTPVFILYSSPLQRRKHKLHKGSGAEAAQSSPNQSHPLSH